MKYEAIELAMQWEQQNLSLVKYSPQSSDQGLTATSKFVLDFKNNQPSALQKARSLVLQALREIENDSPEYLRGYLVTVPSHTINQGNTPCEYLCAALVEAFPHQYVHLKQALRRVAEVPKSATSGRGNRPSYNDHCHSIRYIHPASIRSGVPIILVDDILTKGETSRACRAILTRATNCQNIPGLFLARTTY